MWFLTKHILFTVALRGDPGEPGHRGRPGQPGSPGISGETGKEGRPGDCHWKIGIKNIYTICKYVDAIVGVKGCYCKD